MDECKVIIMGFGSVGQGVANALSMKKELIKDGHFCVSIDFLYFPPQFFSIHSNDIL